MLWQDAKLNGRKMDMVIDYALTWTTPYPALVFCDATMFPSLVMNIAKVSDPPSFFWTFAATLPLMLPKSNDFLPDPSIDRVPDSELIVPLHLPQ
jgi:hypothetical protein